MEGNHLRLTGLTVLLTRPLEKSESLKARIEQLGARVLSLPVLEIQPLELSQHHKNLLLQLDQYSHVIVVSATAAKISLEWAEDYWPQWPIQQQWLAVGEKTAQLIRQAGLDCSVPPGQGSDSEALLKSPLLEQAQKVLLIKGEGGRELIRDTLQKQGIRVDELEVYRRGRPDYQANDKNINQLRQGYAHIQLVHSGDSLSNLLSIADCFDLPVRSTPLLVVSERVRQQALAAGCQTVMVADSPYDQGFLDALMSWYAQQP